MNHYQFIVQKGANLTQKTHNRHICLIHDQSVYCTKQMCVKPWFCGCKIKGLGCSTPTLTSAKIIPIKFTQYQVAMSQWLKWF